MAGVRRSDFSEAMKKDMYGYYLDWEKYEEIAPVYEQIFDIVPSSAAYEKFNLRAYGTLHNGTRAG
jgi:hypothetical protein